MSITLSAYPMAFLINPEEAKNETLKVASEEDKVLIDADSIDEALANQTLKHITVLTNIVYQDIPNLMCELGCPEQRFDRPYRLDSGLNVEWKARGKYAVAKLYGGFDADALQSVGENFFTSLDSVAGRNVRLIESNEYFYFHYQTSYTKMAEIYALLKAQGATQIFSTTKDQVVASLNGQNIKYYKSEADDTYLLEVEQKVTILNIGLTHKAEGTNINYGLTDLKIQTNIKRDELKKLLKAANYIFYDEDCQTPLKNTNATLNWVFKDGYYSAEFSGPNTAAITKEAEIIFRKMNIAANRDLRLINDEITMVYTYKTNYTDKGILLNTLTEHGAEELQETGDEISCKMFGMEMVYYKKDSSSGYTLDVTRVSDATECKDLIDDLNEEYGLNIQEVTYNKIKERLDKENMRLESETVMDDNSIVLTIEV